MQKFKIEDKIVFENDNYFVINKPSGLSVLEDRAEGSGKSALDYARDYVSTAAACHRIDKETSGILVFSKNQEAYRNLAIQFEKREVAKMYHALVHGRHSFKEETIEMNLLYKGEKSQIHPEGKFSATIVESISLLQDYTLVECMPITGRTHQIRAHLAYSGAPIVGDEKYGGKPFFLSSVKRSFHHSRFKEEKPMIERTALHAFKIKFCDVDGSDILPEAPYPKDLQATVRQLFKLK